MSDRDDFSEDLGEHPPILAADFQEAPPSSGGEHGEVPPCVRAECTHNTPYGCRHPKWNRIFIEDARRMGWVK